VGHFQKSALFEAPGGKVILPLRRSSSLDEPKANGFVSGDHWRLVDVREMQRLGFRLPPDCRPRQSGQLREFRNAPAHTIAKQLFA
jgi:hypothetical protein